ncbi:cytidine deaminase-like protein [Cercophora newfieldiana]|uniref:Cytidine deaminase-like protein n=1 Tax=Cercophora newfieldiana TaxID=92897 RepID=A0AA40CL75_9PEZI|nr:cytidine deaminase-like protein [Cercophora newfieldiana]
MASIQPGDHKSYMQLALDLAQKSPPKPTNYRVGAVLVDLDTNAILATGYTLELTGNTHAEQCCLIKLAQQHGVDEENLVQVLPSRMALYTTVEPCSKRLSGNLPCAERVRRLAGSLRTVYVGVSEPETFVSQNTGKQMLQDAGIEVAHIPGFEPRILEVATAGHIRDKPNIEA